MVNLKIKKIAVSLVIVVAVFLVALETQASFQDVELIEDNVIGASTLDMEAIASEGALQPMATAGNMLAGDTVSRNFSIKNGGKEDFKYGIIFVKDEEENSLCSVLKLEARKEGEIKYSGDLNRFEYNFEELNSKSSDDWIFDISTLEGIAVSGRCEFKFVFTAWQTDLDEPTHGWIDREEINNNVIIAELVTPRQTGYNVDDGDGNDGSTPQYPEENEIGCAESPEDAGVTNINAIAVHWTDIRGGNDSIKYQRQYKKVGVYNWQGSEIYKNNYTNYRKFGTAEGSDGVYGSRVRAWLDINEDGEAQIEEVSDWSNVCYVEFDRTPPVTPKKLRRENREGIVKKCGVTTHIPSNTPDNRYYPMWDDNEESDFSHYEYSSFNAPAGNRGLREQILPESEFIYTQAYSFGGIRVWNGSRWMPGEGTYGFAVRAVDKAGNKSDWTSVNGTFEGSCKITYDNDTEESVRAVRPKKSKDKKDTKENEDNKNDEKLVLNKNDEGGTTTESQDDGNEELASGESSAVDGGQEIKDDDVEGEEVVEEENMDNGDGENVEDKNIETSPNK
jgi:hypothetical protein